jgi:hypothetical protein
MSDRKLSDRFPWIALAIGCLTAGSFVGVVCGRVIGRVGQMEVPPVVAARLQAAALHAGLATLTVAVALSAAACAFVAWQRSGPSLGMAIVADVVLCAAFIAAPWITHGTRGGVLDSWFVSFSLLGVLPSVAAALGVVAFVIITRRASQHGEAAA